MANIRTARRSGLVLRGGRNRRETTWFGGTDIRTVLPAGANPVALTSLNAAALALRPFTVIRTRGVVAVSTDQEAADEFQHVMFGQAVISDQAVAIGVTAMPTPRTDSGSDLFFVFEFIANDFRFGDATGFVTGVQERVIDSRAMRKVEDGQDVISVIEAGVVGQGSSVQTFTRLLVKLH